jgi:hypothetical protein
MKRGDRELVDGLGDATLESLQDRFPAEWKEVGEALVAAARTKRPQDLAAFMNRFQREEKPWRARIQRARVSPADMRAALPRLAKARMARLAAEEMLRAAAARVATGREGEALRFRRWSGWLVQRLFFLRGLERKPVSMATFRWVWPLVSQRRILMPLVQPRGIYCFYSRELVLMLADLIGERSCLEIAAGDGTLTRFLNACGTPVHATDDRSWSHAVEYPAGVEALDAAAALERHRPSVVLCSFPPPGNSFERTVFQTPSVDTYVVVTTRHRFAAGDWHAYQDQTAFDVADDLRLSRLVLPPEIDPAVMVFRRKSGSRGDVASPHGK